MVARIRSHAVVVVLCLLAALLLPAAGHAQNYPARPVQFIVPWAPGGDSDVLMRVVAKHVEKYLGQPLPIINIPGVSGTVGLREATERRADGYTITQIHEGLLVSHHTGVTPLNWDSFEPIASLVSSPQYLTVHASSPWMTLDDLANHAMENPGQLKAGVTLAGVPHAHTAMIEEALGIEFSYVGYEGTAERVRALVGGHIDVAITDVASALEFVRNGDLRFLAVGSYDRLPETPDVPTFRELGHNLELNVSRGVVGLKGTPEPILAALEKAFLQVTQDEAFIEEIERIGGAVLPLDREAYAAYLGSLDQTMARLAERLEL